MSNHPPIGFIKKVTKVAERSKKLLEFTSYDREAAKLFPLLVSDAFLAKIDLDRIDDPLMLQVMPTAQELVTVPGFTSNPLDENQFNKAPGLLKKYHGRAILQLTGACPIHCRYCFRRHDKHSNIPKSLDQWQKALAVLAADSSISEIIFSGGDPLMLPVDKLLELSELLARIPHIKRLRIHTRTPIASPERISDEFVAGIKQNRLLVSMVIHMNHPREMDPKVAAILASFVDAGIPLYNQSVLLKGVNDNLQTLTTLSETLIQARVTPYYLHILDPVAGAAHFYVDAEQGRQLVAQMRNLLPGYAVPTLVQEIVGAKAKTPI